MPINLKRSFLILAALILSACGIKVQSENTATAEPLILTATLPPTASPFPFETPLAPTTQPTIMPVEGITITQLNVRTEPSTASEVLGIISANTTVQIIGKDPAENWWQIIYETGVNAKGWITAEYVETASNSVVPVIGGGGVNSQSEATAVVIRQINIRSGPSTTFDSLGFLNANDIVNLTGKNNSGTWLQFSFPAGPEGKGWINSGFVRANDIANLPIVSDAGDVIGTGTPADTALPPPPTIVPAAMDFDSADTPLKTVIFSPTGTTTFIYNGDVSIPDGDVEDWIAFTPYDNLVFIDIQCIGSKSIHVELTGSAEVIICNQPSRAITVSANSETLIRVIATSLSDQLVYTRYIITIKENP